MHGPDHLAGDVEHQGDVLQHARTGPLASHLFHGAAKVEVDDVGLGLFHDACRLDHLWHVAAVDLYAHGAFFITDVQFGHGAFH